MSSPIQKRQRFMGDILPCRIAAWFLNGHIQRCYPGRAARELKWGYLFTSRVIIPGVKLRWILILLIVLTLIAAALLLYFQGAPRLVSTEPAPEASNLPAGEALRLTFSSPMDADSVTQRLSIEPEQAGEFTWEGNILTFTPSQPWPNNQVVTASLSPGARAATFPRLSIRQPNSWRFTVGPPRLAYLYPWNGPAELYLLDLASGESEQLSDSPAAILDYDSNLTGTRFYFSVDQGDGGSAIYTLEHLTGEQNILLECPGALCRYLQVSPTVDYLAYERTALSSSEGPNYPQVWLLPLAGGPGEPALAAQPDHQTRQPQWTPDGQLSYYDFTLAEFISKNLDSGETVHIPSQTGIPGSWHPDGSSYVFPEIFASTPSAIPDLEILPSSHLLQFHLSDSSLQDLTAKDKLDDASPVFAPDGSSIVFARRQLDIAHWTPGRQIWLMAPDGSNPRQLTQAPYHNHYDFAWSPDSSLLAYSRFNKDVLTEPPEIWLISADGLGNRLLWVGGYATHWVP